MTLAIIPATIVERKGSINVAPCFELCEFSPEPNVVSIELESSETKYRPRKIPINRAQLTVKEALLLAQELLEAINRIDDSQSLKIIHWTSCKQEQPDRFGSYFVVKNLLRDGYPYVSTETFTTSGRWEKDASKIIAWADCCVPQKIIEELKEQRSTGK